MCQLNLTVQLQRIAFQKRVEKSTTNRTQNWRSSKDLQQLLRWMGRLNRYPEQDAEADARMRIMNRVTCKATKLVNLGRLSSILPSL